MTKLPEMRKQVKQLLKRVEELEQASGVDRRDTTWRAA
jgi:hypothetical protein